MPHIVVLYTSNLEGDLDVSTLCRKLADTLLAQHDEVGKAVFPAGGTRVFAYPASHFAVCDGGVADRAVGGTGDYGFVYVNLRMGLGRSAAVKQRTGDALLAAAGQQLAPVMESRRLGLTLHIDESPGQVYDGRLGNLHSLFQG